MPIDLRDLAVPVVAAPMAGGPSTPSLVAAVAQAGGLGFLAAGYRSAEAVAAEVAAVRALTSAPFGVNLFVVEPFEPDPAALAAYVRSLGDVPLGEARWDDDGWAAKLEAVLDLRPDVVSFTFACPGADVLARLAEVGVLTTVTVTSVDEARMAVARGAASLAVQGPDAGGHRGTWDQTALPLTAALADLLAAVVAAVDVPVVAGGGIAEAQGVARLVDGGAVAAQVGTAYLLADEAGTNPTHRAALVAPGFEGTEVTRAFTGRWARGLANRFVVAHRDAPAGYPHLHHLTGPLRRAAAASGDAESLHLWAGTAWRAARSGPAADITRRLAP